MKPNIQTHGDELEFLKSQGFAVNPFNKYANDLEEVWRLRKNLEKEREKLHYGIDGMVVKINHIGVAQAAGVVGKTPRAHCAIKFAAQEATSKLTNLVWQVGRTGKVTPVAEFEPTEVAGTTVRRATLHNYKEFNELNPHSGDTIVIRKAGDIIPEVVSLLSNLRPKRAEMYEAPVNCPECSTSLTISKSGVDLECPNSKLCPAQVLGRLSYFTQRSVANINGLSQKQIQKFIQLYNVRDLYDLYNLPYAEIKQLEGFGERSASNLKSAIDKASLIPDKHFLAGLSIEGVGKEVAALIIEKIYSKLHDTKD